MPRRKTSTPSPPPALDAVLRGDASPNLGQLFALLREVNPTSRDVSEKSKRERYVIKAPLISILLERFFDDVDVEPNEDDGDVALIRRRAQPADVTHARFSDLGDEARSRIRRRFDDATFTEPPAHGACPAPPRSRAQSDHGDLLEAARSAVGEYDYERAEPASVPRSSSLAEAP